MTEDLAVTFEANRPRLQAVAYRMLGSLTEAEDAVQETWLRLSGSDTESTDNLAGWLTTVLSRVCLSPIPTATSSGCSKTTESSPCGPLPCTSAP